MGHQAQVAVAGHLVKKEMQEAQGHPVLMVLRERPVPMGVMELQEPVGQQDRMGHQVLQEAMVLMAPAGRMDQQGLQEPAELPEFQEKGEPAGLSTT
jgi:hypothetical protein